MTSITEWTGMRYEDLVRLAQDREQWIVMTANLLQEDGISDDDDDDDDDDVPLYYSRPFWRPQMMGQPDEKKICHCTQAETFQSTSLPSTGQYCRMAATLAFRYQ